MRAVVLKPKEWKDVREQISKNHPKSVLLSRSKMREVLGFTPREHTEWLGYYDEATAEHKKTKHHGYRITVHLDFFNESQRTMFLLKYGDWIGQADANS